MRLQFRHKHPRLLTILLVGSVALCGLLGASPSQAQDFWDTEFDANPHASASLPVSSFSGQPKEGSDASAAPLWGGATPDGFQLSGTLSAQSSTRCLSCHDGVTASSVRTHDAGMGSAPLIGGRLQANHPVGIEYSRNPGARLHDVYTPIPGSNARIGDLLVDGRMECISCHSMSSAAAIPNSALIRKEFQGARDRCMVCHDL